MSTSAPENVEKASQSDTYADASPKAEPEENFHRPDRQKGRGGPPRKRDTHFLCFPLVTDTSIPQLATALCHFREVATKPSRSAREQSKLDEDNEEHESDVEAGAKAKAADDTRTDSHQLESYLNHSKPLQPPVKGLNILPAITHRPPGTFHLTLGVMDLSEPEEMSRALTLLQELDYGEILKGVSEQQNETEWPSERYSQPDSTTHDQTSSLSSESEAKLSSLTRPVSPPQITQRSRSAISGFTQEQPPKISLTGLSTFPSAKSSRVFYAKPSPARDSPFPLLPFGQAIRRKFREAGFITETRPLVLHATVANMRYAVQARGGRTSKGKAWRYGKDRWNDGQVDARELIKCFDQYGGESQEYVQGRLRADETGTEFVWASDIVVDRVAICKMGAEKSDDEVLGQVYPPVDEKKLFP